MAIMHPSEFHAPDGDTAGERKMFAALRDGLGDSWHAVQGFDWTTSNYRNGALTGEIDFVLAHPGHGVVVLEVKGGGIRTENGVWFRGNREMKDPVKQVRDNYFGLGRTLRRTSSWRGDPPPMAYALAFPIASKRQFTFGAGTPDRLVIDRHDLADLERVLAGVVKFFRRTHNARFDQGKLERLIELLAPTSTIEVPLAESLCDDDGKLVELTASQQELCRRLRKTRRMVTTGCAGTGKTLLAIEHAKHLAESGRQVLFVCFTRRLRADLRARYSVPGLEITGPHSLAKSLAGRAGISLPDGDWASRGNEFWNNTLLDALMTAAVVLDQSYDALIVDEAQDLSTGWLDALRCLLADPEEAPIWLFMDPNQDIFAAELTVSEDFLPFELTINCRNTRAIHREVIKKYKGSVTPDVQGPEGQPVELITTVDQRQALGDVLARLCGDGEVPTSDIVVLSSHGFKRSEIFKDGVPGKYKLTKEYPAPQGEVTFCSIRGFKGLESRVVVLCELEDIKDRSLDGQLYVGISRARTHCVVIAPAI